MPAPWLRDEINRFSQKPEVQRDGMDIKDVWGLYLFLISTLCILGVLSVIAKRPAIFEGIYLNSRYY